MLSLRVALVIDSHDQQPVDEVLFILNHRYAEGRHGARVNVDRMEVAAHHRRLFSTQNITESDAQERFMRLPSLPAAVFRVAVCRPMSRVAHA